MSADGKQLEGLVAFVEETFLPAGFEVKSNQRIYNDDGVQIAEFDVEIRGKIGTTAIAWLIECRDRPAAGRAPAHWIEQLYGRRARFGFNKVTAVSTTGFAAGAVDFARREGIELREVRSLTSREFSEWLPISHFQLRKTLTRFKHATLLVDESESTDRKAALYEAFASKSVEAALIKNCRTGALVELRSAFAAVVREAGDLTESLAPNGDHKSIRLRVRYVNDDDHFVVETAHGAVRIREINFSGEIYLVERLVPIASAREYRDEETGNVISQVATFEPHEVQATKLSLEMHRLGVTGETHIIMRRLTDGT